MGAIWEIGMHLHFDNGKEKKAISRFTVEYILKVKT